MSTLKVEVVSIDRVEPHPNADRLEIAHIKGWQCVVGKGNFIAGDHAIYIPIDSILPEPLEAELFKDSKIKLSKRRVKTIKLRGAISQGMLVHFGDITGFDRSHNIGDDVTAELGITKYEPPESISPQSNAKRTRRKQHNPHFHKYTDIENYKNYPDLFAPGDPVWVLEKIHGSNFRAGWVPFHADTFWKRIKSWLGMTPKHEFVYGSHNVQLQNKPDNTPTWHGSNIYLEMVEKYQLRSKLAPGEVVYGEVYGDGVQKGYMYDCKPGERKARFFDLMVDDVYLDHSDVLATLSDRLDLPCVPCDALMGFDATHIKSYVDAPSKLCPKLVREGVVIKPTQEARSYLGRKILKWKSDEFMLKAEDDLH